MTRLIGLVGGTGWPATRDYYEQINRITQSRRGGLHGAQMLVWSFDFQTVLDEADQSGLLDRRFASAGLTLRNAGAQVLAISSNTGHLFLDEWHKAGLPLVHIAEACAQTLAQHRVQRVGILATRRAWQGGVFEADLQSSAIAAHYPNAMLAQLLDEAIFSELEKDQPGPLTRQALRQAVEQFDGQGISDILLGCTELRRKLVPTQLFEHRSSERPALRFWDSTDIHCEAIVNAALTHNQHDANS